MKYKRLTSRLLKNVKGNKCSDTINGNTIYDLYNRLSELEDKIENGTLVELPCKVGGTVYAVVKDYGGYHIREAITDDMFINNENEMFVQDRKGNTYHISSIVKTREEAESKLEELRRRKE